MGIFVLFVSRHPMSRGIDPERRQHRGWPCWADGLRPTADRSHPP